MNRPWRALMAFFFLLAGCAAVGPNYVPPQTTASPAWNTPLQGGLQVEADPVTLASWWKTLDDPELSRLIDRATARNRDLEKARARIREARARRGLNEADLFPRLDASGSVSRSRGSSETGGASTRDLFSAGLDASWELDLFGGVRRSVEAAEANLQAAGEDLHDTLVSLLAEVALNYLDLRTGQARMGVTEESLKTQEETHSMALWRYQAGLGDDLAVQQARYSLESARAQIPDLQASISEAKNRLAVLLGEMPGALDAEMEPVRPIPTAPPEVAVGVPADILRQRPDVRRAERQLAAQTAQIGVATAELYPKFRLSGAIGLDALTFRGLFNSGSVSSSGSAGLSWRIFDAGAIRQNIGIQTALQEQSLIAYESAVLAALEEAENAIDAYAQEQHKRRSLLEAVRSAEAAAELARIKYRTGLADFSTVLETERSLLGFRNQLVQSEGAMAMNLVKLYKALGGGWSADATPETKASVNGEKS